MRIFLFFFLIPLFAFSTSEKEKEAIERVLKKDFYGALRIYEELYKKNPLKPSILQNLSNLYVLLKKEDKAIEVLKNLVNLEFEKEYPYKILRLLLLKNKREFEWLQIASNWYIKTKSVGALKSLIGAKIRIGHFSQAIKLMEKNKIPIFEFENLKENKNIKNLIFLITLDTFRYDLIKKNITPNLIGLKNESYFFNNCYAVTPITLPAHCSIFTGLYPNHTGVRDNSIYKLKDGAETLPEILKNYGYASYGFISSFLLNRRFGLNQGFKIYQDNFIPMNKKSHFPSTRRAEETLKETIKTLNNLKDKSAFFFIHLYDTHAPYEPPFPFDEAYPDNLYMGEASYMDFALGKFFDKLKNANLFKKSMVIVLSDHGEALGENGEPTHGFLLYNPTLHIPFILHLPDQKFYKEINILSSQVDLLPTILSKLKINYKKLDGEDLFKINNNRNIFSETELPLSFNWSSLFKIYKNGFSFISKPSNKLFYLNKEIKDEKIKKGLEKQLEKYINERPFWEMEKEILDEETIKNLKSLGYHQNYIGSKNEGSLPDPEEKMKTLILYQKAISYEEQSDYEKLYSTAKELEKNESSNPQFLSFCAEWYQKIGKKGEAKNAIDKALQIDDKFAQAWFYKGFLYENEDVEKAMEFYKKAIQIEPKHFLSRYNLSRLYLIREKYYEAEKELLEVLKITPEHPYTLNNLGYLYFKRNGDCKKAKFLIEKAFNFKKEDDYLRLSYSSILCRCGEKEKGREILKDIQKNTADFNETFKLCN